MLERGIRTDSGSVANAMLTALLRSRLGFRQFHPGDSYPAVETDPGIQRGQKIRAANVRERSAPGLQRRPLKREHTKRRRRLLSWDAE